MKEQSSPGVPRFHMEYGHFVHMDSSLHSPYSPPSIPDGMGNLHGFQVEFEGGMIIPYVFQKEWKIHMEFTWNPGRKPKFQVDSVMTSLLLTVSPRSETVVSVRFQSELLNWLISRSLAWLVCLGDLLEFSVWERSRWIVFKTKLKNYCATCMVYIVNAKAEFVIVLVRWKWIRAIIGEAMQQGAA